MKILKPLAITKINDERYEYSDGCDTVAVTVDIAATSDLYDGRKVYCVTWHNGVKERLVLTPEELYRQIEGVLLMPRSKRYSRLEFDRACSAKGYIRGVVQLTLNGSDSPNNLSSALIRALIDIGDDEIRHKRVKDYEIVGCEGTSIIVKVTVEKNTGD